MSDPEVILFRPPEHWGHGVSRDHTCERHGERFVAHHVYADRWTNRCSGCRADFEAEQRERQAQEAERYRRQQIARFLRESSIPPLFETARMEDLKGTLAAIAGKWLAQAVDGQSTGALVLVGKPGVGKSHAEAAMLRRGIEATAQMGIYLTAAGYCRDIRATWGTRGDGEAEILERCASAPWLVIDDLGAGRVHDAELVQDLVAERYARRLMPRTIIASNLAATMFSSALGERVADRIRDGATLLEVGGASRRRPA